MRLEHAPYEHPWEDPEISEEHFADGYKLALLTLETRLGLSLNDTEKTKLYNYYLDCVNENYAAKNEGLHENNYIGSYFAEAIDRWLLDYGINEKHLPQKKFEHNGRTYPVELHEDEPLKEYIKQQILKKRNRWDASLNN